jgi:23S rRNA (uracil1939-C5)-methyltransferase
MSQARSIVRLHVTALAAGGDGVAHFEGAEGRRAVFLAKSAPGDVVEAAVDFSRRPARAALLRVLEPSPLRVEPECASASRCGGCDFMHLSLEAQRQAHASMVSSALERAWTRTGRAGSVPAVVVHPAPTSRGYRTRARVAIRAARGHVVLGFRRSGRHFVENVESCLVLDPRLDAALPDVRSLFAAETGEGEVALALGGSEKPVLDLGWQGELSGPFLARMEELVTSGRIAGAEASLPGADRPLRWGDPRALTTGADGAPLTVPSGSFAQANPAVNAALGARLVAAARPEGKHVLEFFAGSGNFSVLLAKSAASLVAVEADARAALAAQANLRARGLSARVVQADADHFELPANARIVVLDPPRAGAVGASERLARSKVRRIVYVSCDPSTLARDVGVLAAAGFRPTAVETFEMFPHTSHVETLAVLEKSSAEGGRRDLP